MLKSDQDTELEPAIRRMDEILIRSALGDRPEEINYRWNPIWQATETEKADLAYKKAQTFQIDVSTGSMPESALQKVRQNQLTEDGTYPGIEAAIEDAEEDEEENENNFDLQETHKQIGRGIAGLLQHLQKFNGKDAPNGKDKDAEAAHDQDPFPIGFPKNREYANEHVREEIWKRIKGSWPTPYELRQLGPLSGEIDSEYLARLFRKLTGREASTAELMAMHRQIKQSGY